MGLLVVSGEFACAVAEDQTALRSLAFDTFGVLGGELVLRLGVVGLVPHADDDVAVPAVLVDRLGPLRLLLSEVVSVAGLEVAVGIVPQFYVDWFLPLDFDDSQWLLVVMRLCFRQICGDLLRESELEMRTLEIQHSFLVYCLLGAVFVAELRLGLGMELSAVSAEANVGAIMPSLRGSGLNGLSIVGCCVGSDEVSLIITQD